MEDPNTILGVKYSRWVLGSARGNDILYMGRIMGDNLPSEHSLEQIQEALLPVPADRIFPPLPIQWWRVRTVVTVADDWDEEPGPDIYLKRPWLQGFDERPDSAVGGSVQVAVWFAHEIKQLEQLARFPPHPNLIRYHGCRVRKGRITGALLGRVPGNDLWTHLQAGKTVDKEPFLTTLASAVDHLHNVVGLVHNDIHPSNIMVSPDGVPTLIDLGSAHPVGEEMKIGVPFECWGGDPLDMDPETHYDGPGGSPTSRKSRDLASLHHLRTWLDNPVLETTIQRQQIETASHFVQVANERMRAAAARVEASRNKAAKESETTT
ncbi:kinase-like domain-containing protein [Lasiosphaeria hispida]|uniref:Kinase-like domain-containing protein n=1 Tax=Lasiosphaeria hispida TaxID=260671 RepID=A0AAJ0HKX5_9PEZI|nr:kinase-like domain-containing protein [Lasiosphaeria hispida]